MRQPEITQLVQQIGAYSVRICRPDAELAPDRALCDAWDAADAALTAARERCKALEGALRERGMT